ncbi:aconitase X swivel domain-containing protein [Specibacter cremeus]|uniref:aconitase X swivel domain-containing protein n=1 Tax=Specibacter cremeus TaxID=1629051 RepID=UPI000F798027|nr:DUF126 domain-containing protein [Specibacter cremeus]
MTPTGPNTVRGEALAARTLTPGTGTGPLLVLDEPLSFWGGTDLQTGVITDPHHPQYGTSLAGRILVMDASRGSSSSSSVLAEQLRAGVGPAAIVLGARDAIIVLGALAAAELYGTRLPIVLADGPVLERLRAAAPATATVQATADEAIICTAIIGTEGAP